MGRNRFVSGRRRFSAGSEKAGENNPVMTENQAG